MAGRISEMRIDVHGKFVEDALQAVRQAIASAPFTIEKVVVIHGYNNGTAIKEALRRLHGPRIVEVSPSLLNPGETVVWLKR